MKLPVWTSGMAPPRSPPEMGSGRLRRPSSSTTGLKPVADGIRNILPFGSPKSAGRHQQTRRSTGGVARSQVDPHQGGSGVRVHRHRRLRNRSPHRPSSDRQPCLREGCLNGLPEAFAVLRRHRVVGGVRRLPDAAPKGLSDARFVIQPAYPGYNPGAGEGLRPFEPEQPRAPVDCAGGGVAPLPPVTALRDG